MRKAVWLVILAIALPCLSYAGEKFDKMTPMEHIRHAKDAISKGVMVPAKMHLDAVPLKSKEYDEAKKLYVKLGEKDADSRRKQEEKNKKDLAIQKHITRKAFASIYQSELLDSGMDAYVSTHGKDDSTLKVKYILISRPLIHKIIQKNEYWQSLREMGFKKVVFTDGYDNTWDFKP